jgi:hypothetical protein
MTPDELVLRVEAALEAEPPHAMTVSEWRRWAARAALRVVREAMQEPDEKMFEAGEGAFFSTYTGTLTSTPDDVWRAMLAASPLGRIDA